MSFLKNFSIFTFFTLISRIFGLIRDIINARVLGANEISDAFFVAFRLPNLFRGIFAEGAMNAAFIPIFNKNFKDHKDSQNFSNKIYSILLLALIFVCILAYIFMEQILVILAPGFQQHDSLEIFKSSIALGRIMFPFLFFISLTALFGSILQTQNRFFPTASYPIIMNLVLIFASFVPDFFPKILPSFSLAWGVIFAGFLQMIFLIISAKFYKIQLPVFNLRFWEKDFFDSDIKNFFQKFFPAILTTCITRIGITIDTIFASLVPAAVSYIYYADRLYQMPLSLIGTGISAVILPVFSKALKEKNKEEIIIAQEKVFEFALILILPAAIGLCLMSKQICILLFGNKFGIDAISKTSFFLSLISLSLPFNVLNNILNSIFFSHGMTSKITKFAFLTLIFNISSNAILFYFISFYSVGIATFFASVFNIFLLISYAIKNDIIFFRKIFFKKILKIALLNFFLIFFLLLGNFFLNSLNIKNQIHYNAFVLGQILFSIFIYFFVLYTIMKYKISFFRKLFINL